MSLASVALFGISRDGLAKGISKMNQDLIIRFHSDVVPYLTSVKMFATEHGWIKYFNLARKERPDVFGTKTNEELIEWLNEFGRETGGDFLPNETKIEVIKSSANSKLPSHLISGVMTVAQIQATLPKKTLVLKCYHWSEIKEKSQIDWDDLGSNDLVVYQGKLTKTRHPNLPLYGFIIHTETIYLAGDSGDKLELDSLVSEWKLEPTFSQIKQETTYFTAAGYKSLMQKILRRQAELIFLPAQKIKVPAKEALISVFLLLYFHPGAFVPDLQRFVGGKESALKRLAVSLAEDTWVSDYNLISDMLGQALISQFIKDYYISLNRINLFISTMLQGLESNSYFVQEGKIDPEGPKTAAYLLSRLGSFQGDIDLMAKTRGFVQTQSKPTQMNLVVSIDHHWAPNLVYFLPNQWVRSKLVSGGTPFQEIMSEIWNKSSRYNPRKHENVQDQTILTAQTDFHFFRLKEFDRLQTLTYTKVGSTLVEYTLPESFIASEVGIIYHRDALICVNPNQINNLSVTRRPNRTGTESRLSPEQEDQAIEYAKSKLARGINDIVRTETDQWFVSGEPLEEWLQKRIEVEIIKPDQWNSNWISLPHDLNLKSVEAPDLSEFSSEEINRANYHISIADQTIEFPSIGRDGGGENVTKFEVGAFKVIDKLACYYPYILTKLGLNSFQVKHFFLLSSLLRSISVPKTQGVSITIRDKSNRTPFQHQVEALEEMKANKNNFIWIPVGMGKTYIVCSYIAYLLSRGELFSIIYTLPSSAIESIKAELNQWGISVNHMVPLKKNLPKVLPIREQEVVVNLINHDHIRLMFDQLEHHITQSLFIIDEVHKTLADTQRTNLALTLASNCSRFVALTGTPTINTNMSLLINWLKMTVTYPIDKNNFWIAISALVSKQVNTGVKVIEEEVFVPIRNKARFLQLISDKLVLRSGESGTNMKPSSDNIREAFELAWDSVTDMMIELALEFREIGVFIVARNNSHQTEIYNKLITLVNNRKDLNLNSSSIGLITKDYSFNLVKATDPGPSIVITTVSKSEGYTLTKLGVMITSVYFSNLATRQQLDGRINRITQERPEVLKVTILTDLLDLVQNKYSFVASIDSAMKELISG